MKFSIFKFSALALLCGALAVQSCTKTQTSKTDTNSDFSNSSLAQVIIATVNASRNYVYVDGVPVNGAALTSGSIFPASGTGPGFQVSPGVKAFLVRDTLGTTTQVPLSFAENMQFGRNYTVFMYDTISAPKQKTVQTDIVIPSDTTARLRFGNFTYTPTAIPAVDIFSKKRNANVFTNVQISDVTGFIPYASGLTDTFYIRPTGTTTNLQNFNPTSSTWSDMFVTLNPQAKRSYTLVFRGSFRAMLTNNASVRTLSVYNNY